MSGVYKVERVLGKKGVCSVMESQKKAFFRARAARARAQTSRSRSRSRSPFWRAAHPGPSSPWGPLSRQIFISIKWPVQVKPLKKVIFTWTGHFIYFIPLRPTENASIKWFAMYTAPTEKYWPEIIGETCFYKVDGVTYYGHSLKGTNGL